MLSRALGHILASRQSNSPKLKCPLKWCTPLPKKSFAGLSTGLQTGVSLNHPMNSTFISRGKHLQMYLRPLHLPIPST